MLEIDDQLVFNGFHDTAIYHSQPITGLRARDVKAVFGDAGGVIGALTCGGRLWRLVGRGTELVFLEFEFAEGCWFLEKGEDGSGEERVIDQVTVAENGQVCVVTSCSLPICQTIFIILFSFIFFPPSPTNIAISNL